MERWLALARRYEQLLIVAAVLVFTAVPLAVQGVHTAGQWIGASGIVLGSLALAFWRQHPLLVLLLGPMLLLISTVTGPDPGNFLLLILLAYAALTAEHFSGRAAWVAGLGCVAYITALYFLTDQSGSPGLIILVAPGFLAGTALRLRRETAEQLAERGRELDAERELFADVSVRNERARIASELHDIVGHALSVMVVQAAAGQRLVAQSPEAAAESLAIIAESARQGHADLQRLIDLLAGTDVVSPDLSLIDEVIKQAARSGLQVTCRLEGDRDGVDAKTAHVAFRVVQESLTNALRHAPGAQVRVLVRSESGGRAMTVLVENDATLQSTSGLTGTGRGLFGLRERVLDLGGSFSAGPAPAGGWAVVAELPGGRRPQG